MNLPKPYIICKDNIIRDPKNPKCPNAQLEPLVIKLHDEVKLTYDEEYLYGCLIMSLTEIILNNKRFKHQDLDLKEEIRSRVLTRIVDKLPKYFDITRGSKAYSLAFRIGYCEGIQTLLDNNKKVEVERKLLEAYNQMCMDAGRKISPNDIEMFNNLILEEEIKE